MPTLYLLSYATSDLQDRKPHAIRAYNEALSRVPTSAHKLSTIRCLHWHIPPREICAWYSGVSEVVQSYVVQVNSPHPFPCPCRIDKNYVETAESRNGGLTST